MVSYPHLDTAQLPQDGKGEAKFSMTLVFAPGTDLSELKKAAVAAAEEKYPGKGAEMLRIKQLRSPFRDDAEAKDYPAGSIFINVRTKQKPGVVYSRPGPDGKHPLPIPADKIREEVYPGSFGRASLRAFAYDSNGNKGISFALNNFQKTGDGERLDGRVSAENEFDADLSAAPADLDSIL